MINFCIILYNKYILKSESYKSLIKYLKYNDRLLIFDNSTNEAIREANQLFCHNKKVIYLTKNKNIGLSKAYNYLVEYIKYDSGINDYVITFDDDTIVSKEYMDCIHSIVRKNNFNIYIPIVYSNDVILSPSNVILDSKIQMINNIDDINLKKVTAINSGLCISMKCFNEIKYNETLFLDLVDHSLFSDIKKKGLSIFIMKQAKLEQCYSQFQDDSVEKKLKRFEITMNDSYNYARHSFIKYMFFLLSGFKQAIILNKKFKVGTFFRIYFKVWISN